MYDKTCWYLNKLPDFKFSFLYRGYVKFKYI